MTLVLKRISLETIPEFKLRDDDETECLIAGMTGVIAVRRSVAGSAAAYAHYIDGELVCMWGYRWQEYSERTALMWLLSTPGANNHKMAFGRASKHMLKMLEQEMTRITIVVHHQHTTAIKWLEWLGFKRVRTLTEHFNEMQKDCT